MTNQIRITGGPASVRRTLVPSPVVPPVPSVPPTIPAAPRARHTFRNVVIGIVLGFTAFLALGAHLSGDLGMDPATGKTYSCQNTSGPHGTDLTSCNRYETGVAKGQMLNP